MPLDDRELVGGEHRWWYSPYWQAAKGVRMICDHNQRFETVMVGNVVSRLGRHKLSMLSRVRKVERTDRMVHQQPVLTELVQYVLFLQPHL